MTAEEFRQFALLLISHCKDAAEQHKKNAHPFNDKFGDHPEKLIEANAMARACDDMAWMIRQEAEKRLRELVSK